MNDAMSAAAAIIAQFGLNFLEMNVKQTVAHTEREPEHDITHTHTHYAM